MLKQRTFLYNNIPSLISSNEISNNTQYNFMLEKYYNFLSEKKRYMLLL